MVKTFLMLGLILQHLAGAQASNCESRVSSNHGGEHPLKSFIASCQQSQGEPWAYLCDVLTRIAEHRENALDELLPHAWKPASA